MKARRLIESASYDLDRLNALRKAFDHAWEQLAPNVSSHVDAIEAARLKLAGIVLGLAKSGNLDSRELTDAAVQLMQPPPQRLKP